MSEKSILQCALVILARATIWRYKPMVIGVTGSMGKTSTRLAIFAVIKKKFRAATAEKNYNNEIGLPLAILGMRHCGRNLLRWGAALASAALKIMMRDPRYPEVLVLEYGVDRPGDMDYLFAIARPSIGVVTAIGEVPAHVEFFRDPEELIGEKSKLVAGLPSDGYAILNHDDEDVFDMREKTAAHVLMFGVEEHAEVRFTNYKIFIARDTEGSEIPKGITIKLSYKGSEVPVRLDGVFGMPHAYAAAAAAAAGITMGMNLVEIAEALRAYMPPPGRMRLIKGNRHSFILDDTYNASSEAMRAALETLRTAPGGRKIAVLGDMREIGRYSEQAHRTIGDQVAGFVDLLFCVGMQARFIADEAKARGMAQNHLFVFDDACPAGRALDPMLQEGDVILVKGSQTMRMEKAVEEIMHDPEHAKELLVRQEECWKNN